MRSWMLRMAAVVVAGLVAVGTVHAAEGKGKKKGASIEKMFKKKDANSDGKVTIEEFKAGLPAERSAKADKHFARIDKNGDGGVTLEEFKAAREAAQKRKENK